MFFRREESDCWCRVESPGFTAWLGELTAFWHSCSNSPFWEGNLLSLMARLAEDNIGLIDWEPELPLVFQKIMYSLGLPVYYKKLGVGLKICVMSTSSSSRWIVSTITPSSSTLHHLDIMMNAINSYYHPTSEGRYSDKLVDFLSKLISAFCSRLHRERYDELPPSWIPTTSPGLILTDDQVGKFCEIVMVAVMDLAMSKRYVENARGMLQILSSIRPDMFLPPLISKFYSSLETLTSPHKFTAAAKCLCSVSRILVRPGRLYPSGPTHVIDILFSVLPGIDCNDIKKTMVCFQLISVYARLVPLTDLSAHLGSSSVKLSPSDKEVCQQSSKFKQFVIEFMERCFSLIENSTLENTRQEHASSDTQMSSEETSINMGIVSCFDSVLHQADEIIQDAAITKMELYLKGRILEPKISGKIASGMMRTCAKISPRKVLPIFLPHVCSVLKSCLADVDLSSDRYLGDEIMFNMVLLSDLLCLPGCHLVPYVSLLEEVLASALCVHNKEGHTQALTVLRHATHSLSHLCLAERSKIVSSPSTFPLEDWGQSSDLSSLDIKWFIPGQPEFDQVVKLLDNFLEKEVVRLEKFMADSVVLTKEDLFRSLKTISSIIIGCSGFLRHWEDEEAVSHVETEVEHRPMAHVTGLPRQFDYKLRGENTRRALALLMDSLVDKILSEREDDTKALNAIIIILKLIMFQFSISDESYEKHSKDFYQSRSKLEVKLFGKEKHIRAILLDRVLLQHEKRLVENIHVSFNKTHQVIFNVLVRLATSHYSKVRIQAQSILSKALKLFPYSYNAVLDQVLPLLRPGEQVSHEQFKGALYIVLQNQLLVKHNWRLQSSLWPALVSSEHNEKPSVTALIKSITGYIHSVDTWTIAWPPYTEAVISAAGRMCVSPPSELSRTKAEERTEVLSRENLEHYTRLVSSLCDLVQREDSLHWRHYNTTLTMLCAMLRYDVPFPTRAVNIFTDNLIHDNIIVRKASLHVVDCVLKQNKRSHPKLNLPLLRSVKKKSKLSQKEVNGNAVNGHSGDDKLIKIEEKLLVKPGERSDNSWLQYSSDNRPLDQKSYDEPRYLHKTYFGYYTWPAEDLVYAPSSEQPKLDRKEEEMPESERIIFRFFTSESNVSKLVEFLSLENKKGQDHFDTERFGMFKALFRNFGDSVLAPLRCHIEKLVTDHRESHQRAAAELIAGLVRGSKHWTYDKVESLWSWLLPIVRQALTLMSPETIKDWGTSFASSSDNRDPNRVHWLMEVAMEEPIRSQGSFIDSSRLYMLQGVVAQQRWRVGELLNRLLVFLRPFLDHPYHNVRCRLGSVLTNIFSLDVPFVGEGNANLSSPFESDFVKEILPSLNCLREDSSEDVDLDKRDSALRLLQTLSKWISSSTASSLGPVKLDTLSFLPLLLGYEWYDKDPQLARDCQTTLSCLSRTLQPPENIKTVTGIIKQTLSSQSWKTRLSSLDFLQAVIFNNFIMFLSPNLAESDWMRRDVIMLVLDCLKDLQVEVRVKAAQVREKFSADIRSTLSHCRSSAE